MSLNQPKEPDMANKINAVRKDGKVIVVHSGDEKEVSFTFSKVGSFTYSTKKVPNEVKALFDNEEAQVYLTVGECSAVEALVAHYKDIEFPSDEVLMADTELPPALLHAVINFVK